MVNMRRNIVPRWNMPSAIAVAAILFTGLTLRFNPDPVQWILANPAARLR